MLLLLHLVRLCLWRASHGLLWVAGGDWTQMSSDFCKYYLRCYRMRTSGSKRELVHRIRDHLEWVTRCHFSGVRLEFGELKLLALCSSFLSLTLLKFWRYMFCKWFRVCKWHGRHWATSSFCRLTDGSGAHKYPRSSFVIDCAGW